MMQNDSFYEDVGVLTNFKDSRQRKLLNLNKKKGKQICFVTHLLSCFYDLTIGKIDQ